MAKARESAQDPPAESEESGEEEATSGEEEEVNGGSGSESESESEQEESKQTDNSQPTKKPSSAPAPAPAPAVKKPETLKPPSPDTSSSDEEDSGSDSESDSPETKPDPNIKPIASKPVETTAAAKKPKSKANSSLLSSPTKTISAAGGKRPATSETGGDGEGKEAKRLKKKPEKYVEEPEKKGSSNDESRKLFQRLWSEDDEIAILKGMIDYSAKKKADPVANLDAFHEFIKKSLHIDVTRTQLQDKIRRLRKKYANNADKEKKGKERIFAKDHEQKAFELSKKVWGNENSTAGKKLESPKSNGEVLKRSRSKNVNTKKHQNEVQEESDKEGKILIGENTGFEEGLKPVNLGLRNSGIEEWIMEHSHFVDEEKRANMDEKWKNFKLVEAEFYAKKLELMLEETKLISDALKSSTS